MSNPKCETEGHIFWDAPDRETLSEEYYDCDREGCDYVDRRTK